jgi:hypothetical protein
VRIASTFVPVVALAAVFAAVPALAQSNACADCHQGNGGEPWPQHQNEWGASAHGQNGVGCEKCHRGDATAFDVERAHAGVLPSSNPASPTNRRNVAGTCGGCHAGPYAGFQGSRHSQLPSGGAEPPSCATCHGEVAARRPAADVVAGTCNGCHAEGKPWPRPEQAARAQRVLAEVQAAGAQLRAASASIARVGDAARRERLRGAYEDARRPLAQAVNASHRLVFDDVQEPLAACRERTRALLAELQGSSR